ncbi:MAG: ATP-binding protein [Bacteroidota bacterium]|nr:ATP-binding protein [Bacteroidota bacterium]
MLIRFVVSNFLSFNEEREFNMLAGNFKNHKHHIYKAGKVEVLKATAMYGANGAGKSNLVKAFRFFQEIVEDGKINQSVNDKKFKLYKANANTPISFEIEFSIENKIYSYGLSIDNLTVVEEWLYESGITVDDKLIFERKLTEQGKISIEMANKYKKTPKQKLFIELMEENILKNNELFLGQTDSIKIDEISKARKWIENNLIVIFPDSKFSGLIEVITKSKSFNLLVSELLKTFGTGVSELDVETIDFDKFFGEEDEELKKSLMSTLASTESFSFPSEQGFVLITKENGKNVVKKVISKHYDNIGKNITFDLNDESDGTQRLLDLIPAFNLMMESEITFIIDEIDRSLHPALLKSLIKVIMANTSTKGQLIFTTHESNLLDMNIFRQDEIWFAEKDKKTGGTQIYSLSEFKPRYDLDIQKGYLNGRFGAIPFLSHLEDLNWHTVNA